MVKFYLKAQGRIKGAVFDIVDDPAIGLAVEMEHLTSSRICLYGQCGALTSPIEALLLIGKVLCKECLNDSAPMHRLMQCNIAAHFFKDGVSLHVLQEMKRSIPQVTTPPPSLENMLPSVILSCSVVVP